MNPPRPVWNSGAALPLLMLGLLLGPRAAAENPPTTNVRVTGVSVADVTNRVFSPDRILLVTVPGVRDWYAQGTNQGARLSVYLNSFEFHGLGRIPQTDDVIAFDLNPNNVTNDDDQTSNREAWKRLLVHPGLTLRDVTVTVGPEGQRAWPVDAPPAAVRLKLETLWEPGLWLYAGFFVLLGYAIFRLGRDSSLLRDRAAGGKTGVFSLARCQMAWWLFLVLASFAFIWLVTGVIPALSGTALALLGLSSGTGLISAFIDATPGTAARPPADPARDAANAQLHPAQRFFVEILSDESGLTVYRLQIAVWTLALGIVFCVRVYKSLTMPELPDTLLGLMGLSSATFLGFKTHEKPPSPK